MTAKEIKKLRATLDMTQEEFARALNVAHLTVVRWENKMAKPSRKSVKKLTNLEKEIKENQNELCNRAVSDSTNHKN